MKDVGKIQREEWKEVVVRREVINQLGEVELFVGFLSNPAVLKKR